MLMQLNYLPCQACHTIEGKNLTREKSMPCLLDFALLSPPPFFREEKRKLMKASNKYLVVWIMSWANLLCGSSDWWDNANLLDLH